MINTFCRNLLSITLNALVIVSVFTAMRDCNAGGAAIRLKA